MGMVVRETDRTFSALVALMAIVEKYPTKEEHTKKKEQSKSAMPHQTGTRNIYWQV